jgi:hypothetical protein
VAQRHACPPLDGLIVGNTYQLITPFSRVRCRFRSPLKRGGNGKRLAMWRCRETVGNAGNTETVSGERRLGTVPRRSQASTRNAPTCPPTLVSTSGYRGAAVQHQPEAADRPPVRAHLSAHLPAPQRVADPLPSGTIQRFSRWFGSPKRTQANRTRWGGAQLCETTRGRALAWPSGQEVQ